MKVCDDAPRNIEVAKAAELASKGLKSGYVPILADGCSNGAYYMRGPLGRICAMLAYIYMHFVLQEYNSSYPMDV